MIAARRGKVKEEKKMKETSISPVREFKNRLEKIDAEIERMNEIHPLWDTQEEYLDRLYIEKRNLENLLRGF